jgi:hypothetical protein
MNYFQLLCLVDRRICRGILIAAPLSCCLTSAGDASDANLIRQVLLWEYTNSLPIYNCPADQSTATWAFKTYPCVRSVCMNGIMNGNSLHAALSDSSHYTLGKYTEIIAPDPAHAFVFLDENPLDIEDGAFLVNVTHQVAWGDVPANYHNGACGFSFANGHSGIERWRYHDTVGDLAGPTAPTGPNDVPWVQSWTTSPKQADTPWLP